MRVPNLNTRLQRGELRLLLVRRRAMQTDSASSRSSHNPLVPFIHWVDNLCTNPANRTVSFQDELHDFSKSIGMHCQPVE
ncbi:hypothetical protein VTL71DRAFT_8337, partial [Oculimacula yallundae]